jgi:probable phosphoglycerate mutase
MREVKALASTLLYLARHGEQELSASGGGDGGLSALGERQAHQLGRRVAGVRFAAVRHSPLRRAAETAQITAGYLPGVPVSGSELLRDRTPVPTSAQAGDVPAQFRPFLEQVQEDVRDEGGEQLTAAIGELSVPGDQDRCELLITHNFVIGWFVRQALDAPAWRWIGLNQFNCALTIIQYQPGRPPMLVTFNDLGHLPVELRGDEPIALRS